MHLYRQQGFTLIELIMVIVVLGILAATALPKFADLGASARIASLKAAHGALLSSLAITHSQALVGNIGEKGVIVLEGKEVAMVYGYPTADAKGIVNAISLNGEIGWIKEGSELGFTSGVASSDNCKITYTAATDASTPATAVLDVEKCS